MSILNYPISMSYDDFNINDPAHFSSEIKKLNRYEQLQVLKIILDTDNSSYTENSNGSYVSLHTVKDKKILYKIYMFINSCKERGDYLKDEDLKRDEEIKQLLSTNINESESTKDKPEYKDEYKDDIMGDKVVLKKNKVKFSGNKGKLLKSFRNVSKINKFNIKTTVATKKKKTLFITETNIDEDELEDIDEDDTISNQGYDVDEDDDDDVKDIDICEEEAEIEHENINDNNAKTKDKKKDEDEEEEDEEEDEDEDEEDEDEEDDEEDDDKDEEDDEEDE